MEPVTISIVAALVAGAVAGSKDIATNAIKDSYAALKQLVVQKYGHAASAVRNLEKHPSDEFQQTALAEQLSQNGADTDEHLQNLAKALLKSIAELRGDPAAEPLFDFDELDIARDLKLTNLTSVRQIMRAGRVTIGQDFVVDNVHDGLREGNTPKKV